MPRIPDVITWKFPDAEFVMHGSSFALWSHPTEPQPDASTLATWEAEYIAADGEADQAFDRDDVKIARAVAQAAFEHHSNPGWTVQDYRNRIKTIYKSLP